MKKKLYQKPAFRAECIYFEDSLAAGSNDLYNIELEGENVMPKVKNWEETESATFDEIWY